MLDERLSRSPRAQRALRALAGRALNFGADDLRTATTSDGWHIDDYCQPLPAEAGGQPEPGGSFAIAQELMRDYAFADPAIVRAVFDPASPLAARNMLLQVRFGPLRLFLGCRVGPVVDETRVVDGRSVRIWGWSYGTLERHLEQGQMDYAVWKWLDSGDVQFRIHVVSRRARVRNPLLWLGFRLVGRREQVRFARRACERMGELVEHEPRPRARSRAAHSTRRGRGRSA